MRKILIKIAKWTDRWIPPFTCAICAGLALMAGAYNLFWTGGNKTAGAIASVLGAGLVWQTVRELKNK